MTLPLCVLFAGGGTGGHLFPAIAIAEVLKKPDYGAIIHFAGSIGKIEARIVPQHGYPFHTMWISGFRRSLSLQTLIFPIKLAIAMIQAALIIRKCKPDVVVGTGGYVSGPVVYMASKMGRHTLIHEQNEFPGATTRKLAPIADEVHVTFESSRQYLPKVRKLIVSGNPVRPSLERKDAVTARKFFGLDTGRATVFVFGGSLGASSLNQAMMKLLPRFKEEHVQVIWQTGSRDIERASQAAEPYRTSIIVREFIHEMNMAYSAATLVVSRAGATSLAEITALGLPSVLIPYPHATADHQRKNAHAMQALGAADVVDENEIDSLGDTLFSLLADRSRMKALSDASRKAGRPRAAYDIAEAIVHLAREGNG